MVPSVLSIFAHWKTENTSHYSCDVTMGEKKLRIHINSDAFAKPHSLVFNILRSNRVPACGPPPG